MPSAGSQRIAKVVIVFTFFRVFFADGTNVRKNVVKPLCVWIYCWSSGEKSLYLPVVFPTDGSGNTFTRRSMKSLLYQELRDLARRILDTPEQDLSSLQGQARVLYEKLTVLRYTEGLLEELRETLEDKPHRPPSRNRLPWSRLPAAASPAFPQDASGEKGIPQPHRNFPGKSRIFRPGKPWSKNPPKRTGKRSPLPPSPLQQLLPEESLLPENPGGRTSTNSSNRSSEKTSLPRN